MSSPLTSQPSPGNDTRIVGDSAHTFDATNYEGAPAFEIGDVSANGSYGNIAVRGLIKFSALSTIDPAATITGVQIQLWNNSAGTSSPTSWDVNFHRVLKNWVANQATWNKYDSSHSWDTAGCSASTDRTATPSATVTLSSTATGAMVTWSSAGLIADVQAIVAGTAANYGWIFQAPSIESLGLSPFAYSEFFMSEYSTDAAKRPRIIVDYTLGTNFTTTLTDTQSTTEGVSHTPSKLCASTQALADGLLSLVGKKLTEAQGSGDALVRAVGKALAETTGSSDAIVRAIGKALAETQGSGDAFVRLLTALLSLNDTQGTSDALTKQFVQAVLWELVSPADPVLGKVFGKIRAENAQLADWLEKRNRQPSRWSD